MGNINTVDVEAVVKQVLESMMDRGMTAGTSAASGAQGPIPKTARVAMLTALEKYEVKEFPIPEVGDGDILVKVEGCGICGTDAHEFKKDPFGLIPVALGHEGTGEIVKMGKNVKTDSAGKPLKLGDKVVTCMIFKDNPDITMFDLNKQNVGGADVYGLLPDDDIHLNGWFSDYILIREGSTVFNVSGYTEEEKIKISQDYLIPKKVKEHGLKEQNIRFSEKSLRDLINYYTRESGVRNLEREIANVCRKVARNIVSGKKSEFRITEKNLENYLGKKRYHYDIISGEAEVGVTTGLAWTIVGGDTLFIETTVVPGSGKLVLTGQLGEVMQESAKAGISYIRSIADKLEIDHDFYKEQDLHIHIPEGAVPKDGPSAGVTMCTAIISTLTETPVRKDIAMTGEITLRGKVLPVGGIREKVLAAHRAGIKKVLLPADNEKDIEDIPKNVRRQMEFVLLHTVDDALEQALVKDEK